VRSRLGCRRMSAPHRHLAPMSSHPLDNPVWNALDGPHRHFATRHGLAVHYARDVAAFSAIADDSAQAYADLAHDLPAGAEARLVRHRVDALPDGWVQVKHVPLLQMIAPKVDGQLIDGPAFATLGATDVAAVSALIDLTSPGRSARARWRWGATSAWSRTDACSPSPASA